MANSVNFKKKIIMTNKLTVLVAAATGMLGAKIVSALLDKGDVNVRAMVQSINDTNEKIVKRSMP
jgi:thioester reductase-like protein